jgi:hypothetical protein
MTNAGPNAGPEAGDGEPDEDTLTKQLYDEFATQALLDVARMSSIFSGERGAWPADTCARDTGDALVLARAALRRR